ncbi:MAG TPA: hypothetical protein VFD73_17475 [Gemmatimonadales bacterium]|nr:hypothetical protein [Gemmatimonadales bacterium]
MIDSSAPPSPPRSRDTPPSSALPPLHQRGIIGATLSGLSFVLPSLAIVVALAMTYFRCGRLPRMQAVGLAVRR